jgi:hypothetical protein
MIANETYTPKFKIGDVVIYDGKIRSGCTHNNSECGRVIHLPNNAQPYYQIEVMEYGGGELIQTEYESRHIITFLANGDDLKLWKSNTY